MKFLKESEAYVDADGSEDLESATVVLESRIAELQDRIMQLPAGHAASEKARLQLEVAAALVDLERKEEAWHTAREAFDAFAGEEDWQGAAHACDILFQADQPESLAALGQGIWLAVTFPIEPELTVALLQHVVDETPPDSDGAAVAAVTAQYVVDMRAQGKQHEDLSFFTNSLLATVARRHSDVETQEQFDLWFNKLELGEPEKFLPRLRNVVDVLVQEDWWIDREAIWAKLPVN
jgi:hypothetical protein